MSRSAAKIVVLPSIGAPDVDLAAELLAPSVVQRAKEELSNDKTDDAAMTRPGDDPTSEYSQLRDRIKAALARIEQSHPSHFDGLSGPDVRAFVNYVTGAKIPNGPIIPTMRLMAEACEAAAKRGEA